MPKAGDHIVIVGGTSGLGHSIAQAADAVGAKVTIAGRGRERAEKLARSISPRAAGLHIDLEDSASIDQALADGEPIDHLVLTPVYGGNQSIKDFKVEEALRAARIKIVAFAEIVSKALPRMKPTSSIVLFGGAAKARPYPGSTMVTIVNGGMIGMARTLAVELAPIRVNGISPGLVEDSPRWRKRIKESAGRRRSDAIANADPPAADDRRHCPRRVLPHGQSRGEWHRPRTRRRHPPGLTIESNCQLSLHPEGGAAGDASRRACPELGEGAPQSMRTAPPSGSSFDTRRFASRLEA